MLGGIGAEKSKKPVNLIWGPPSPSNISISETAVGGTVCTGTMGGGRIAGTEDGASRGKQNTLS